MIEMVRGASVSAWFWRRAAAMLAIVLPCLSGLAYLTAFDAPRSYVAVNAAALALALGWIGFGSLPSNQTARRIVSILLIALMAMPLIAGPAINGVTRWISIGGVSLHMGMVAIPLLACLAAHDRDYATPILLSGIFITLVQPDAASAFALMLASVGLYFAWKDWKIGVVSIAGFAVGVLASLRGELPPQPFVERFLADLVLTEPALALGLALSLFASFFLMLWALPRGDGERYALAGTFAGFSIAALLSNYPHILIGYGAAPILGYGLALAAHKSDHIPSRDNLSVRRSINSTSSVNSKSLGLPLMGGYSQMAYPKLTDKPGALETARAIRAGEISVAEAVDAAITRIEHFDAEVNALAVPDFERASATAKAMDASGVPQGAAANQPLFGVPMTIKESFDVEGLQSCWGHENLTDYVAKSDSDLVRRLKAAGAIILGKTNVPIDLSDWQSFNAVYGRTTNPHNSDRSPGGSSGGSAAAVASGMVSCDFGTDIGGSVRVPAHFCGVWGHKSTWGLVSKQGHHHPQMARREGFVAAHDGVLSIAGPLARNAADLAILMQIGAQIPLLSAKKPLRQCRLLAITEYPGSPVDASVSEPTETAIAALIAAGVSVDRTSKLIPDLEAQQAAYLRMLNTAMARGAPAPDGKRATASDWFDMLDAQAANEFEWARLFDHYDFVLAPPAPVLAIPHLDGSLFNSTYRVNGQDLKAGAGLAWAGIATFPNLPATVLPIGSGNYEGAHLPCGMQVIGPKMSDLDCIDAADQIGKILHG